MKQENTEISIICSKCFVSKTENEFYLRPDTNKRETWCKDCKKDYNRNYRKINAKNISKKQKIYVNENKIKITNTRQKWEDKNKEKIKNNKQQYYIDNKDEIKISQKIYHENNKIDIASYQKEYQNNNKDKLRTYKNTYIKQRKLYDPAFKIRLDISKLISYGLKITNSSKNGESILKYLTYSIKKLKEHLESQFESWMTWDNWGIYDQNTWDDNDSSTWTWQIDHIIPHSTFKYTSMEDERFKKCWALENLRPYSAKQNWLDGIKGARHYD